jgi:hypothetical protein
MPRILVEVDVDLKIISTDVLIEELKTRDKWQSLIKDERNKLINQIYEKRNTNQDYQRALDDLIYETIGRT